MRLGDAWDDPARAGFTKTGQPSSSTSLSIRARSVRQSRSPITTNGPTGSPAPRRTSFMYALSMPIALASTPEPTYRTPAISSRP